MGSLDERLIQAAAGMSFNLRRAFKMDGRFFILGLIELLNFSLTFNLILIMFFVAFAQQPQLSNFFVELKESDKKLLYRDGFSRLDEAEKLKKRGDILIIPI